MLIKYIFSPKMIDEAIEDENSLLSQRERNLLKLRGFYTKENKTQTLRECAKLIGLSAERIRQIESQAQRKLAAILQKNTFTKELNEKIMELNDTLRALHQRIKVLERHTEKYGSLNVDSTITQPVIDLSVIPDKLLVTDLELSVRACGGLLNANIKTVKDLVKILLNPRRNLEKEIRNFGKKTIGEILEELAKIGITFEF